MNEDKLQAIIEKVVAQLTANESALSPVVETESVPDLSAVDYRKINDTPNPANAEEFLRIRQKTAARLGVWRAGPRYRTSTYLRFRADHAAAMDAVFTDVPEELLHEMGLFSVSTKCDSKNTYLTRPDLGRQFSDETIALLRQKCAAHPDVQLIVSDGLSSTSIDANLRDVLPAIKQGLELEHISCGTPFFIKYGRVGAMDAVTEALGAKVTVILIGERPGLASGESMSAYITYGGYVGIPEANRTVVSNIHRGGTSAGEAGAFIAELCGRMLRQKASGLNLKD